MYVRSELSKEVWNKGWIKQRKQNDPVLLKKPGCDRQTDIERDTDKQRHKDIDRETETNRQTNREIKLTCTFNAMALDHSSVICSSI